VIIRGLAAGPAVVWLVLLALLAASCASASLPLGPYNAALNMTLAAIMLLLLATFLMNLGRERTPASHRLGGLPLGHFPVCADVC
jgi:hypothetical protein